MSLDLTKLENLKDKGDKKLARCPACAKDGGDSKGEHLVIYPDGKYGCVAHPGDEAHNKEIFQLVGIAGSGSRRGGPIPVRVRRPACVTRTPKTLLMLKSLSVPKGPENAGAGACLSRGGQGCPVEEPGTVDAEPASPVVTSQPASRPCGAPQNEPAEANQTETGPIACAAGPSPTGSEARRPSAACGSDPGLKPGGAPAGPPKTQTAEEVPPPPKESPERRSRLHTVSVRPGLLVGVVDGPDWQARLAKAVAKCSPKPQVAGISDAPDGCTRTLVSARMVIRNGGRFGIPFSSLSVFFLLFS